jgi:hypothetical protein
VVATLGSVSNFYFWRSSHAYFASSANPSPLLHFWSLAVESSSISCGPRLSCSDADCSVARCLCSFWGLQAFRSA